MFICTKSTFDNAVIRQIIEADSKKNKTYPDTSNDLPAFDDEVVQPHAEMRNHNNVYINQQDAEILVNSLYFFIKWLCVFQTNDSPKHAEQFNEKIRTIHKNLCISLVYIHIAICCTVHTISN